MAFTQNYILAKEDFRRQRTLAAYQFIAAKLTGKEPGLLSFEEVSRKLHISGGYDRGIEEIPIDAIIGSVSRHSEFTRNFMPLTSKNIERWSRVKVAVESGVGAGLPPIEVYKIGEAYFVIDGHNRVSVAREIGAKYIQASVTEVRTRATLDANATPEDLILSAEYADFLEETHLDTILPGESIRLTVPGYYRLLREHIEVHRYYMGLEQKRDISIDEAVTHWFTEIYQPVKNAIIDTGILKEFPGRTEADLYIWVSEHRYLLGQDLGWVISPERAARNLATLASPRLWRVLQRWGRLVIRWLTPASIQPAPSTGEWRKAVAESGECLFYEILVPITNLDESRPALSQAQSLMRCSEASLQGLHVVTNQEDLDTAATTSLKDDFNQVLVEYGLKGSLAVVAGEIAECIVQNASLADVVVVNVAHPTGPRLSDRLGSGLRTIILRSPQPVLAVPGKISELKILLLAYDGSPRGREALFMSAFLSGRWKAPLYVISVNDSRRKANLLLDEAALYLNGRDIDAHYLASQGDPGEQILASARETGSDLILMGGYGNSPAMELVLGSTVDRVLREADIPVMICK